MCLICYEDIHIISFLIIMCFLCYWKFLWVHFVKVFFKLFKLIKSSMYRKVKLNCSAWNLFYFFNDCRNLYSYDIRKRLARSGWVNYIPINVNSFFFMHFASSFRQKLYYARKLSYNMKTAYFNTRNRHNVCCNNVWHNWNHFKITKLGF